MLQKGHFFYLHFVHSCPIGQANFNHLKTQLSKNKINKIINGESFYSMKYFGIEQVADYQLQIHYKCSSLWITELFYSRHLVGSFSTLQLTVAQEINLYTSPYNTLSCPVSTAKCNMVLPLLSML